MKRTDFIAGCGCPKLARAVLNQLRRHGLDWHTLSKHPQDYRDARAGVNGFIYYSETIPFAKRNMVGITLFLREFEQEIGTPLKGPKEDDEQHTQYLNWLAWFALEYVVDEIMTMTDTA